MAEQGKDARYLRLERALDEQAKQIELLRAATGLESVIRNGVGKLEKLFAPLAALAPERAAEEADWKKIAALRKSLLRPEFTETSFLSNPRDDQAQSGASAS